MLLSCRQGEEGGEQGRVSHQTKEPGRECVYIGVSQPAVSDFRPRFIRRLSPGFQSILEQGERADTRAYLGRLGHFWTPGLLPSHSSCMRHL